MKTLVKLFMCIAAMVLFFSCNMNDQTDMNLSGLPGTNSSSQDIMQEAIFLVEPNGTDDTENLKEAFNQAIGYGPGAVVQLVEGEYHINFIYIREFFGTFRGAGKGKTIITTVSTLDDSEIINQKLNIIFIRFVGGDIHMSGMTITTPPGEINTGHGNFIDALVQMGSECYGYTSVNDHINAVIDDVEFAGYSENCGCGLSFDYGYAYKDMTIPGGVPLIDIDLSLANCTFHGFLWYGTLCNAIKRGNITVGTKSNGNHFYDIKVASFALYTFVNVELSVVGNTFDNPTGTRFGAELNTVPYPGFAEQVPQAKVSACNIEQNTFNISGGTGGFLANDRRRYFYPDEIPMVVQVKNNLFNMSNNAMTGIGSWHTYGMVIRNNIFSGSGQYGLRIMCNAPNPYNENGLMLGNNLSNATFSVASVLFDKRTKNWTIVGGDLGESVLDLTLGAGNHIITGMNVSTSEVPLGQTIVDNLEEIRDPLHDLDHN